MKKVRFGCLFLILGLLVTRPSPVLAYADGCCDSGYDRCNLSICGSHGGALLCNIHVGGSCGDLCFCSDGYFTYDGLGCPPCAE